MTGITLAVCNYTMSAYLRSAFIILVVLVMNCTSVASVTAPTSTPLLFYVYIKKNPCAILWNSMQINFPLIDRSVSLCLTIITFFMLKHIKNCRSRGSRNVSLTSSRMVLTASEWINSKSPRCNKVCRGLYISSWFWLLFEVQLLEEWEIMVVSGSPASFRELSESKLRLCLCFVFCSVP